jgi:hypothetical protein
VIRFETELSKGGEFELGGLDDRFIHQHDRNVVADRVDAPALSTFETLAIGLEHDWLLANRADQNVEQLLGNHAETFYVIRRQPALDWCGLRPPLAVRNWRPKRADPPIAGKCGDGWIDFA